jgi:hypothetical protein
MRIWQRASPLPDFATGGEPRDGPERLLQPGATPGGGLGGRSGPWEEGRRTIRSISLRSDGHRTDCHLPCSLQPMTLSGCRAGIGFGCGVRRPRLAWSFMPAGTGISTFSTAATGQRQNRTCGSGAGGCSGTRGVRAPERLRRAGRGWRGEASAPCRRRRARSCDRRRGRGPSASPTRRWPAAIASVATQSRAAGAADGSCVANSIVRSATSR